MRPNDGLPPSCSLRKTACPSSATVRTASGPPPWIGGQVGAGRQDERLAGDRDRVDRVVGQRRVDRRVEREQRGGSEGVGPGVVLAVVEGDQADGRARQGHGPQVGLRDALGVGHDRLRALEDADVVHLDLSVRGCTGPVGVLPDHGAAHADADAHGGEAVADLGALLELARQLVHQAYAGRGQRVPHRDRAAVGVHPRVVVGDAVVLEEGEHLHGERLVDLEGLDVVDGQAGQPQRLLGRRDRAGAHHLGLDADEGVGDQAHLHGEAELARGLLVGQQRRGGTVVDARRVAGGDVAVRAERGLEAGERLHRRLRAHRLVGRGQAPAGLGRAGRDRHEVGLDLPGVVGGLRLLLAADGVLVDALLGDGGVAVVEVLRGLAHDERVGVHDPLGQDARVGVDALAHRVAAHVLDAAGDGDVVGTERDARGGVGHGRHRARRTCGRWSSRGRSAAGRRAARRCGRW